MDSRIFWIVCWKWLAASRKKRYEFLFNEQGIPTHNAWGFTLAIVLGLFGLVGGIIGDIYFGGIGNKTMTATEWVLIVLALSISQLIIYKAWFFSIVPSIGINFAQHWFGTRKVRFWIAAFGINLFLLSGYLIFLYINSLNAKNPHPDTNIQLTFFGACLIVPFLLASALLIFWELSYKKHLNDSEVPDIQTSDSLDAHLTDGDPNN